MKLGNPVQNLLTAFAVLGTNIDVPSHVFIQLNIMDDPRFFVYVLLVV